MPNAALALAWLVWLAWLAWPGGLAGCARMLPPSGGPEDKEAPRIVAHEPDSAAVAVAAGAPLKLIFSEPMNHSSVRDWLLVAPWPGKLDCGWDSSCITCRPEDGWGRDTVYTVVLSTEALDRRRNRLARALEFVFTTGESLPTGSISGVVRTRSLKAQGLPVCLFPWPASGLGDPAGPGPTPNPRDALSIGETDAQGRFRLQHVPWGEDFLLGALWDESRNRIFDEGEDLWGFYPAKVRATAPAETPATAPAQPPATGQAPPTAPAQPPTTGQAPPTAPARAPAAAPPDSAGAKAGAAAVVLGPTDREIYLVYPDEPGDITGEVSDSACAGYVAPAAYRARADSLKRVLSGEIDAMGFSNLGDSTAAVTLTRAEEESLRVAVARIDSLLAGSVRDSVRCAGPIWVFAFTEGDSVPAGESRATGPFELRGLPPGDYRIEAFRDLDGNGDPGPGEPRGRFATYVELAPGRTVAGVSFPLGAARKDERGGEGEGSPR
jgi:hypothetical protein